MTVGWDPGGTLAAMARLQRETVPGQSAGRAEAGRCGTQHRVAGVWR